MKPIGILYIAVGIIAIVGAIFTGYIALIVGQALGVIQGADASQLPLGADLATLQQQTASLGTLLMVGWIWIITVIVSGAVSVRHGLKVLKSKK